MKSQWLLILLAASSGLAQGPTFQNLDFESATIVSAGFPDPAVVQFDPAFPGWVGRIGSNNVSVAYYDERALDSSQITLIDSAWSSSRSSIGIPRKQSFSRLSC